MQRKSPGNHRIMDHLMLRSKLDALQCHYTWDLDSCRSRLFHLRDQLEDIGTEEGYSWLGHIYNLQGFVYHRLGLVREALRFLRMATEAFRQMRNTVSDEGPWLVVNYGNLAWMHHDLGEQAESAAYLTKVDTLMSDHPSPSPDSLHPEICAEKAWSLMKFSTEKKLQAVDLFQKALRMQPHMVEWQSSYVLVLENTSEHHHQSQHILEKMRVAREHDPENLYLAAVYLETRAQERVKIGEEARELASRVLRKPISSYSGLEPILRLYRNYISMDEAIDLAEEALERHPDNRYLKKCAAVCYKIKIFSQSDNPLLHSMMKRAISLHEEVVSLYPHSSLRTLITLTNLYARSNQSIKADHIFEKLINSEQEPEEAQMLCNRYARHLLSSLRDSQALKYHMKAAVIPIQSVYRQDSLRYLDKIREKNSGDALL
ncbi:interferon-induced protein with tetratricopeptide repeats 2-like [Gouania willdenowi]|uniref:Interferon-induced protein with tetratricopeptide repeats 2-like n=1 Tax=Gouania willdenowi TaxID=441366 RepID=A0A8C5D5D2_GOUWI|nr:interferon-induced protein with tetratricopeptide repeats 2-like [Gouania willdenowi]